MSDVDGAAPAAVDGPAVSEAPPAPLNTEGNPQSAVDANEEAKAAEAKAPEEKPAKPVTAREALKNAAAKVDADEKAKAAEKPDKAPTPVTDAKPAGAKLGERPRTETGQFAATKTDDVKPAEAKPSNYVDPPSRFSPEAKTAWKDAPEPVRAEVHRATKELEQGLQKYKGDADAFGELKEFDTLAKSQGTTLKEAMSRYVNMENMLRKDPIAGLQQIAQNLGIPLRDIAAHIAGQKPDQIAGQQDRVISELRQTVAQLQQQIGGVTKDIQKQREDASTSRVVTFASQPGHERFEELAPDIQFFLANGRASDLEEAYRLAERLNPGSSPATTTARPASEPERTAQPAAQNRAGTKSITGAPGRGSTPLNTPASSPRKALERAFAAAGR